LGIGSSGSGVCVREITKDLARRQIFCRVIKPSVEKELCVEPVYHGLPPVFFPRNSRPLFHDLTRSEIHTSVERYSAVFAHVRNSFTGSILGNFHHACPFLAPYFLKHGIPYVVTIHGPELWTLQPDRPSAFQSLLLESLRGARFILVPLPHVRSAIKRLLPGSEVIVNPLGVNIDTFSFRHHRAFTSLLHAILIVGALEERKNISLAIQALSLLPESTRPLLLIAGRGALKRSLAAEAMSARVKVIFLGKKTPHELANLYSSVKLVITSSLAESFGLTILEALACGTFVVGTPVGVLGFADDLLPGDSVLVTEDFSAQALARQVQKGLSKTSQRKSRATFVQERFSWSSYVDRLLPLFEECLRS